MKAQTASMIYEDERDGGKRYLINLIDTPGHIDFSYEGKIITACLLDLKILLIKKNCEAFYSFRSFIHSSPLLFIFPSFPPSFLSFFRPSFLPSFLPLLSSPHSLSALSSSICTPITLLSVILSLL